MSSNLTNITRTLQNERIIPIYPNQVQIFPDFSAFLRYKKLKEAHSNKE